MWGCALGFCRRCHSSIVQLHKDFHGGGKERKSFPLSRSSTKADIYVDDFSGSVNNFYQ
jgi:hypothetical protein